MRQLLLLAGVPLSAVAIVSLAGCGSGANHFGSSSRPSSLATLASAASGPSRAPKTDKPQVASWPDPASLEQLYPEEAAREHINGLVRIAVTLDKAGRATDTHILSETPPDLGFGAAASTLAHLMRYSNPTGHIVSVTLPVKFNAPPNLSRLQRKLERLR
jgi:TonB family protein